VYAQLFQQQGIIKGKGLLRWCEWSFLWQKIEHIQFVAKTNAVLAEGTVR